MWSQEDPLRPWKLALPLGLALVSCGGAPPPAWIPLGERAEVVVPDGREATLYPWRDGHEVELVQEGARATLRIPVWREDWRFEAEYGLWHVPMVLHIPVLRTAGRLRLETPRGSVPRVEVAELLQADSPGFTFRKNSLVVCGFGDAPPADATLACDIPLPSKGEGGRVRQSHVSGDGISLLPGGRARVRVDIPPDSVLRFGTTCGPLLDGVEDSAENLFRIRLDGKVLFEGRSSARDGAIGTWHVVPLPAAGRAGAEFIFKVEGALADTAFIDPRLGPRDVGHRGERPWPEPRPDIVLLLADTFRADNMASYGGQPGITPHLDELAREALCFRRAWSTATWTLPAHASLFSGYYPPQVVGPGGRPLAQEVETLAERLAQHGYRTGAVTGGGFVSIQYGLDQGFGYFEETLENSKELTPVLDDARAFLAADDGRPMFLFVHTYRAHWPYEVSVRARTELGERLGIRGDIDDLLAEVVREAHALGAKHVRGIEDMGELPRSPRLLELARELRAHYLGGVSDLDHELGGFVDDLRASGVLEHGFLVFTSDHGEGFLQHSAMFHSSDPFEEQARIPLLVAGRGLTGRPVDDPVSLVDLAPTLMELTGLAPAPDWPGRSLLAPRTSRTLFGFEAGSQPEDALFVLDEERKIFLTRDGHREGRLIGAYDLALDAREEHDLSGTQASWPPELRARHAALLDALFVPVVEELGEDSGLELDERKAAELEALGY